MKREGGPDRLAGAQCNRNLPVINVIEDAMV